MRDEVVVRHCSPTLAGIKTGSLFSYSFDSQSDMHCHLRRINQLLTHKGLRIIPLRYKNRQALIYIYRPEHLYRDLQHQAAEKLLQARGYCIESPERCVMQLMKRLENQEDFPHEIGLFLGYPPEDVCGFIENGPRGCKCVGCWKVYGDVESAQKTFSQYKQCTGNYCRRYAKGWPIERLAVVG